MVRGSCLLILTCLVEQSLEQRTRWSRATLDPGLHGAVPSSKPALPGTDEERQKEMLLVSAADVITGTNVMIYKTGEIRENSDQCASFEIGFVLKTMEESYRKMLDLYNSSLLIKAKKGDMRHMGYLQRIEQMHWSIYHYHNMIHEIERKYKMDAVINASGMFEDGHLWTRRTTAVTRKTWTYTWKKRTTSWWHPLEYGWNTDYYVWK